MAAGVAELCCGLASEVASGSLEPEVGNPSPPSCAWKCCQIAEG
jgi:hypothetical protein